MALIPEIIKANASLASLTDDQITAITTLSANDEATVIGAKVGEIHGAYDKDMKELTGLEKNQNEKSYDFIKRVVGEYKTKSENSSTSQVEIDKYKGEIAALKKQITDGSGDAVTKQQLKDAQDNLVALQTKYDTDKAAWDNEKLESSTKITNILVGSKFDKAVAGLKFKPGYSDSIQAVLLKSAKDTIMNTYKPDWIESEGKKVMVFRDKAGEIYRNKNNALNPYTVAELISEQLKDVIDTGKQASGAGTKPYKANAQNVEVVDISSAKSQIEADEVIVKYLMQMGITRGSREFAEKQMKLRTDNNVSKLPMR